MSNKERVSIIKFSEDSKEFFINDADLAAENAWAYGEEALAIANASHAEGKNTQAGAKGYLIPLDENNKIQIYKTEEEEVKTKIILDKVPTGLKKDDIISIQANGYYQWYNVAKIVRINDKEIFCDNPIALPKDERDHKPGILFVASKPNLDGGDTIIGLNSHVEGMETHAIGDESHAEGYSTVAAGRYAHTEGCETKAAYASHAEGYGTEATNLHSHAEGYLTKASGKNSHAEGKKTIASANQAHAEGEGTVATLESQHVQGKYNEIDSKNKYAHITGWGNNENSRQNIHTLDTEGNAWFKGTIKSGENLLATEAFVQKEIKKAEGLDLSKEAGKIAEGYIGAEIFNIYEGNNKNIATGNYSHAEGNRTKALGDFGSHAEGYITNAIGSYGSHAEGNQTTTTGNSSHAEGRKTTAQGPRAHAEGNETQALADESHAEGYQTIAFGTYSHSEGLGTIATRSGQHVQGKYNTVDGMKRDEKTGLLISGDAGNYAHIVGNGTSDSARSNAHTLDWNGNAWYQGDIYSGGIIDDNGYSKSYRIPKVYLYNNIPNNTEGKKGDIAICEITNTVEIVNDSTLSIGSYYRGRNLDASWASDNNEIWIGEQRATQSWYDYYHKIVFTVNQNIIENTNIDFIFSLAGSNYNNNYNTNISSNEYDNTALLHSLQWYKVSGFIGPVDEKLTYDRVKHFLQSNETSIENVNLLTEKTNATENKISLKLTNELLADTEYALYFGRAYTDYSDGFTGATRYYLNSTSAGQTATEQIQKITTFYIKGNQKWYQISENFIENIE